MIGRVVADDDWRLRGQEDILLEAELVRKPYRAYSEHWEHDHCAFCWAKFMDPAFSPAHKQWIDEHPEVLTEGYATTASQPQGADYHWVCPSCFDDFRDRFKWHLAEPSEADHHEER
jgi:hypothetical protein